MLKPQDVVLLLKLLANSYHLKWFQAQMARDLCISVSENNGVIKRLIASGLLIIASPVLTVLHGLNAGLQSTQQIEN